MSQEPKIHSKTPQPLPDPIFKWRHPHSILNWPLLQSDPMNVIRLWVEFEGMDEPRIGWFYGTHLDEWKAEGSPSKQKAIRWAILPGTQAEALMRQHVKKVPEAHKLLEVAKFAMGVYDPITGSYADHASLEALHEYAKATLHV